MKKVSFLNVSDTDTDSRIFSHKNNLLSGNANFPAQYQRNSYNMMPQQSMPQQIDDQVYREQPQMTRNDWPQMPQQQQQAVMPQQQQPAMPPSPKQGNAVWPEKLAKQIDEKAATHKKESQQHKDSEYSDEYAEGEESQPDGDDVTTTEAPKKVTALKMLSITLRLR
jgi:hypothetical protein